MTIRDIKHAHQCASALMKFFEDLWTDEPVDASEGMTSDEALKAKRFACGLHATLDDCVRRTRSQRGFTLIEVLISTALGMMLVAAMSMVLLANARLAATLSKTAYEESQARARLSRQVVDLNVPVEGVTIELDPSTPEEAVCKLYHLTTNTPAGKSFDAYASRGCVNQ
jgi:prepilin-type N-terminal cleavage/methylation domain-containing protein